ncbi:cytochrome C [Thiovibrio sp. JS02]
MPRTQNPSFLSWLLKGSLLGASLMLAANTQAAELLPGDCVKCHDKAPQDIADSGGAHKAQVTCVDCHEGHPPRIMDIIPACNKCHDGSDHFKLKDCLGCHTNPHTPLAITLGDGLTEPCLTCHTEQIAQLKQHASKHTAVACSTCHREKHKVIPNCTDCHAPHTTGQEQKDCLTCHKPHMPLEVTYPENTPSSACAACHDGVYKQIKANPAKHSTLECATCHQERHKMIPKCQGCHGDNPHPGPMHAKFPQCGQCHGIAHDLNK